MVRSLGALLTGLLLVQASAVQAADDAPAPAGAWKLTLPFQRGATWLVKLESKEGKWTGTAAAAEKVPEAKVGNVTVADGVLKFDFRLEQEEVTLPFEGALPKNGAKILGSIVLNGKVYPAEMEKTALGSFDPYDLLKEDLTKQAGQAEGVRTALELLGQAADKSAKPEEVRDLADKAIKWSAPYGERWHREITLTAAETLADQKGFGTLALEYARQAEKSLDAKKDSAGLQRRVLRALAAALDASDKKDEAKDVQARLEKIPVISPQQYAGRKSGGDEVALVELFTGAQCPPCVTADLAFDALNQTFKPSEVVFLEYHLHIPRSDPLTVPDNDDRAKVYKVQGTPTIFVNGKEGPPAGGRGEDEAQDKYDQYNQLIQPLLEKPAKAHLQVTPKFADGKAFARVEWSNLAETGDNMRLRVVLVEPEIAYTGSNKVAHHHDVVRGFFGEGGVNGLALKDKTGRSVVTIDAAEVKKKVEEAVKNGAEGFGPYFGKPPAVELKDLRLVAFVQNDDTQEILQAVQVDLPTK